MVVLVWPKAGLMKVRVVCSKLSSAAVVSRNSGVSRSGLSSSIESAPETIARIGCIAIRCMS